MSTPPSRQRAVEPFPIAFYLGTFNPIHLGHVIFADTVRTTCGFERLVFIPAGEPPHRQGEKHMAPAADRLAMVRLAADSLGASFSVDALEVERAGPSYTVDTLAALRHRYDIPADSRIPVLMGSDALSGLASWRSPLEVIRQVRFYQARRLPDGGWRRHVTIAGEHIPLETQLVEMPTIGISSSLIRERLREGRSIRWLVLPEVENYLTQQGLYAAKAPESSSPAS
jgi:nicotinate-nucleotide adenylyltransferase